MVVGLFVNVAVQAILLSALLYLLARHEADFDYLKTFYVVLGIVLINGVIFMVISGKVLDGELSPLFLLALPLLSFLVVVLLIQKFCWVPWGKALLVAALFVGIMTAFDYAKGYVARRVFGEMSAETLEDHNMAALDAISNELAQAEVVVPAPARPAPQPTTPPRQSKPSHQPTPPPPVAAAPGAPSTAYSPEAWQQARQALKISGVVAGNGQNNVAFINNATVRPGDVVAIQHQGQRYEWTLMAIEKEGLRLQPRPPAK